MPQLQAIIEEAFERRAEITPRNVDAQLKETINTVIEYLDQGKLRVAEKINGEWVTHQWIKKAVLLSFRIEDNAFIKGGFTNYFDKVPSKFADYNSKEFREGGFRVVPPGCRAPRRLHRQERGADAFLRATSAAYVDEGTMVDTWATVGSCAQIGKNVHLSGGVGIGGVLEPVQANPTIIEDNCFIGARSEIVEGVIVEEGSVISMGVFIGQSTKIFDRETGEIHLRPRAGRLRRGQRQPAFQGRQVQPVLRGDREEGGCQDPGQDRHQRVAARHLTLERGLRHEIDISSASISAPSILSVRRTP